MTPYQRKYEFTLTDLLDQMTIDQIKEVLLPTPVQASYSRSLGHLSADVTALFEARGVELNARMLRLIVLLAQLNLHVWRCKDRLDEEPENYTATLRYAQDLNGLRNCVRNSLQRELNEASPARRRASFFSSGGIDWCRKVMSGLEAAPPAPWRGHGP